MREANGYLALLLSFFFSVTVLVELRAVPPLGAKVSFTLVLSRPTPVRALRALLLSTLVAALLGLRRSL